MNAPMKTYWLFPFVTLLVSFVQHPASQQTSLLTFHAPQLYPEGVAYDDKAKVFYVSSVTTGTIGAVDEQGNYSQVLADSGFKSSFGLKVDPRTNTLWACISDPNYSLVRDTNTYKKMARVIRYDLAKKTKLRDINLGSFLPGNHFANDLAMDAKGNVYITDSFAPLIYKIDPMGKESVIVYNNLLKSDGVGLNGIVCHPRGFLLVAHSQHACIYKIDLLNPNKISKVKMPMTFPGIDGLLLTKNLELIVVQNNGINRVSKLSSQDNWTSAHVDSETTPTDHFAYPTTATFKGDQLYVLNSKLNELADSTITPSQDFSLQPAQFKPVRKGF